MAEQIANCIICEKPLSDGNVRILKEESIRSCIDSSIRRKDKKHLQFRQFKTLNVHTNCAKQYTWERNIELAERKLNAPSNSTSTRRSSNINFDFNNLCFICEKDASDAFIEKQRKVPANKKQEVHMVTNQNLKNTLVNKLKNTEDRQCLDIYNRLLPVEDLSAVGARYHGSCHKLLYNKFRCVLEVEESEAYRAAKFIANYILQHKEECQFSVPEILTNFDSTEWAHTKYIKKRLKDIFQEDIIIHSSKYGPIITFLNSGNKILTDNWYKNKCKDPVQERKRLVQRAGKIILEDIRAKIYECNTYGAPDVFLQDIETVIPQTLTDLLQEIILKNKHSADKYAVKITSISHAIIAATRPRSFLSSLQF